MWIFGAWFGHRYTDNSRYLFENVCKNEEFIRPVWLTREQEIVDKIRGMGHEAYLISSLQGYWLSCRAGLVVVSNGNPDINRLAISRAKKLHLWHGSPMKKIGLDDKFAQIGSSIFLKKAQQLWRAVFPFVIERWDVIIACSDIFKGYMASAFGVDPTQVKVTGYPRNDILLKPNPTYVPIVETLMKKYRANRMLLYAPTFRSEGKENIRLFDTLDIKRIESFLVKYNAILLIKMHYIHRDAMLLTNLEKKDLRIYWLQEEDAPEINPLLPYTDILITDYSGVYFDFLLLDRPIVFAPFDIDQYISRDRKLYEDYNVVATSGPKCDTWNEVIDACQTVFCGDNKYRKERKLDQKKYNSFVDANNSSRVIEVAMDMVNLRP